MNATSQRIAEARASTSMSVEEALDRGVGVKGDGERIGIYLMTVVLDGATVEEIEVDEGRPLVSVGEIDEGDGTEAMLAMVKADGGTHRVFRWSQNLF